MSRIRILASILLTGSILGGNAFAADAVTVRASTKDDYTRIVFEWPKAPSYVTDKTGSDITLKFQQDGDYKISGDSPSGLPRVTSYKAADAKTVKIGFQGGQDVRHFAIGNKVIVDIRGPEVSPPAKPPEAVEQPVQQPVAAPVETAAQKIEDTPLAAVEPAAAKTENIKSDVQAGDLTIAVAGKTSAIAAFERFGNFWIVSDAPNLPAPQVTGKNAGMIPAFQPVKMAGGSAFYTKLPQDVSLHATKTENGWSFSAAGKDSAATDFKRVVDKKGAVSLLWPVASAHAPLKIMDPLAGDELQIVPVDAEIYNSGGARGFVEFGTLKSYAGLALQAKSDDIKIQKTKDGILIGDHDGLALSPETDIAKYQPKAKAPEAAPAVEPAKETEKPAEPKAAETPAPEPAAKAEDHAKASAAKPENPLALREVGPAGFFEQKQALFRGLDAKPPQSRADDYLKLARTELSQAHGPEALGFLNLAAEAMPDIAATPPYKNLSGLASLVTGDGEAALKNFSDDSLKNIPDTALFKAAALAELEDWKQAGDTLLGDITPLTKYPAALKVPLALNLAEVALRAGKADVADRILALIKPPKERPLTLAYQSAFDYLGGESLRQQGHAKEAANIWKKLVAGNDDLYRAKAGLALTGLQLDKKEIKPKEAIDRLEGLRYAWRGDELETAVNFMLGKMYVANKEPAKALTLLKQAKSISPDSEVSEQISSYMVQTFKDLFTPAQIKTLDPVDATALYDEFSSLAPEGPDKQQIVRQLAERLVDADLLQHAETLLQGLITGNKLAGEAAVDVPLRLASIQLLDIKPDTALQSLGSAEAGLAGLPADTVTAKRREIAMLRAQALSDANKPDEAFATLEPLSQTPDVLRLRADIAWSNQRWQAAADALEELASTTEISPTRPVNDDQAETILNWAVALYLADNRAVLANLRDTYMNAMAASPKAKQFEVVTRPRQTGMLTDRETINSIIDETAIFKGFLESFATKAQQVTDKDKPATAAR